jgi:fibronectin-binding autotransporter adhesin
MAAEACLRYRLIEVVVWLGGRVSRAGHRGPGGLSEEGFPCSFHMQQSIERGGLCALLLACLPAAEALAATWDAGAGGGNLNWSTFLNWSDDASPAGQAIVFNDTGSAAGTTVTSVVDTNYTVSSLQFTHGSAANQTLQVSTGQALTVNGSFTPTNGQATAVLLRKPDDANTATTNLTGDGTFTVNSSAANFLVGFQNATSGSRVTLDMSGLSTFNATVNIFGVGRKGTIHTDTIRQESGYLVLAKNSTVTANAITVGDSTGINGTAAGGINQGSGSTLFLSAGGDRVNNLYADSMIFGRGKASGNMQFNSGAVSTDTVTIRAKNGTGAVGDFIIGDRNMSSTSGTPSGTVNFGAGKVDAVVTNLYLGRWGSAAGTSAVSPTGTFTTGTNVDCVVTVTTAFLALGESTGIPTGSAAQIVTGNLNVNGGVFSATTLNLATGSSNALVSRVANVTVDGGTFRFGTVNAPTANGSANINFRSGTIASIDGTARTLSLPYSLGKAGGGTTVAFGQVSGGTGGITLSGAGTLVANTTVEAVRQVTISGVLSGNFGLTKTGDAELRLANSSAAGGGTLTLASTQTGTGTTLGLTGGITVPNPIVWSSTTGREAIVSTGTGNNALTGGMTITGSANNQFFIANNQTSGSLTFSGGINGPNYTAPVSLRGSQTGAVGFLNGPITTASNLEINGNTDWTVNAVGSAYSTTRFVGGVGGILLGANDALATSAPVLWESGRSNRLDLNGFDASVAGLSTDSATALVTNDGVSGSTLTLTGLLANLTFAGTITDGASSPVSLAMNSPGRTQTLAGANTFTGTTTVGGGTLAITGSLAGGAVSVQSGATLGGSGTIGGATSILGGGILAPGTSPGTLTITSTLALADTSILSFELDAADQTAGGGINDLVTGVTDLTLGGVLNVTGIGDFSTVTQGTMWRLINYSGSLSGGGLTIGSAPSLGSGLSYEVDTGTAGQVNLVVVPEPATFVGLIAGGLGIAAARRFRNRR